MIEFHGLVSDPMIADSNHMLAHTCSTVIHTIAMGSANRTICDGDTNGIGAVSSCHNTPKGIYGRRSPSDRNLN